MAHIRLFEEDGDERARVLQQGLRKALGFLPGTYQAMGRSGRFLEPFLRLENAAGANLDRKARELIAIAVSAANGCGYCVHAHRSLALKAGCSEEEITGAIEVAAVISASNTFNKATGLTHDITPEVVGVAAEG